MKLLNVKEQALEKYKSQVKGNRNISTEQARRKLTRNVALVKETSRNRIKFTLRGLIYKYGNLHITVRFGTIVDIENHKNYKEHPNNWIFPKRRYIELNKQLGIDDCKYTRNKRHQRSKMR